MRKKRLKHYADVVCKMFAGWRMSDDLEVLSDLPDGKITINLIEAETIHSEVGVLRLYIATEIQTWLKQEFFKEKIDCSAIKTASLEVKIDTQKVATNKKKVVCFHLLCNSLIKTDEVTYTSNLREVQLWHTRIKGL